MLRGQGYASVLEMAAEQGFRSEDQPVEAPISGAARDPGESPVRGSHRTGARLWDGPADLPREWPKDYVKIMG